MTYITLITLVNNKNSLANSDGAAKKGKTTKRKKKNARTHTHPHTPDGLNVFHKKFRLCVPQVLDQIEISKKKKQQQKQKKRATTQGITTFSILSNFAFCAILFPEFL